MGWLIAKYYLANQPIVECIIWHLFFDIRVFFVYVFTVFRAARTSGNFILLYCFTCLGHRGIASPALDDQLSFLHLGIAYWRMLESG